MKPTTTDKSGEPADYGGRGKKQYYAGKKSFMKKRAARAARRVNKLNKLNENETP
jgi:hypothetical protein